VRVALALEAMATRFELVLVGDDAPRLRSVGEEALREIEWAEAQLSRYIPTSPIAWINARAGTEAVRVDPRVFGLLSECARIAHLTDGGFDPTVGPLVRAWGFLGATGSLPDRGTLRRARDLVGMESVELDAEASTVRLPRRGMELDLGAVGKGWALDRAVAVLQDHSVTGALLHGGTSSVHVLGKDEDGSPWTVGWRIPGEATPRPVCLQSAALSVSSPSGKAFVVGGRTYGHVLDPRSGEPTQSVPSACVTGPTSTLCDALSTAVLVLGDDGPPLIQSEFPGYDAKVASC
jgi:FAD:protein FMN transferase